jgi:hypothetical protein
MVVNYRSKKFYNIGPRSRPGTCFTKKTYISFFLQLPENLGSVRTISQGKGTQLLLGSTRNSILQGTFELNFQEIVTGHVDEVWALATHPQQNQFLSASYDQVSMLIRLFFFLAGTEDEKARLFLLV